MVQPLYRLGDVGPPVAEIRAALRMLGLLPPVDTAGNGSTDGIYAFETAEFDLQVDSAVRGFQQQRGAAVDGIVGPATWRLLGDARWRLGDRVLRYEPGHPLSGDDIAALQRRLFELGFNPGRADGIFGHETETALRDFQRNVGIQADGTCGPATFKALDQLARTVVGGAPAALREAEAIHRSGPSLAGKVVVIDPGHGGRDRGNTANGLVEAELAEDLAARIEGRLAATGVTAYLTRGNLGPDDLPPTDAVRADTANRLGADLLLSLHVDIGTTPRCNGVSSYFFGQRPTGARSTVGARFADLLQRELTARTDLLDCHCHEKTWDLLRLTRMPAVWLELGYVSNPADAERLADPVFRDSLAEGVVVAVQRLYLVPEEDSPTGSIRLPDLVGG
jgi:N-acetylmuramoyl-L-alanine amidase